MSFSNGINKSAVSSSSDAKGTPTITVYFVCGQSHCGKSTYIAQNLADGAYDIIDAIQFQYSHAYWFMPFKKETVYLSYALLEATLVRELNDVARKMIDGEMGDCTIVVEGTYAKRIRRMALLQDVRTTEKRLKLSDVDVDIRCVGVWVHCDRDEAIAMGVDKHMYDAYEGVTEPIDGSDGFDEVIDVHTKVTDIDDDIKRRVTEQSRIDRIDRDDLLGHDAVRRNERLAMTLRQRMKEREKTDTADSANDKQCPVDKSEEDV